MILPPYVKNGLIIIILVCGCLTWFDFWYVRALDDNYNNVFKETDFAIRTVADIPEKYHKDFIEYRKTKGEIWLENGNHKPYLWKKNVSN